MAFNKKIRREIAEYVEAHLPRNKFYSEYFWFISDPDLRSRLEDEYKAARYLYKLLEGLQVENELLAAQCKNQILVYASIYEAVLHHVLLQEYALTPEVVALTTYQHKRPINISQDIREKIQNKYKPAGSFSVLENLSSPIDPRKIVFEDKARTAKELGLINEKIEKIVCEVYSMRNAIHLHAQIRRGVTYDLKAAKKAYWHLQGFTKQVGNKLVADNKATRAVSQSAPQNRPARRFSQISIKAAIRKLFLQLRGIAP